MDLNDLTEMQRAESEKAESESTRIVKSILSPNPSLELYPEFKQKLKNKVYTNRLEWERVTLQLPFYDVIILPIFPIKTAERYEREYGISLEQTLTLIDSNKVVPLLTADYTAYADLKNSYMDRLLVRAPPTLGRMKYLDYVLMAENGLLPVQDVSDIFELEREKESVRASLHNRVKEKIEAQNPEKSRISWNNLARVGPLQGDNTICTYYVELCIRGYGEIAERMIALDPNPALLGLGGYSEILVTAPYLALDGEPSISSFYSNLVRSLDGADNTAALSRAFPIEIGEMLINRFSLVNTTKIGFEGTIAFCRKTEEARRALFEFDRAAASARASSELVDKKEILMELFDNANQEYKIWPRKRSG